MDKNNIISLKLTAGDYVAPMPIEKLQQDEGKMIPFGENNLFPQDLLDLVEKTSLVSSIIDKITKYIYGEGINNEYKDMIVDDKGNTFSDLVYGVINDYITFGAFAIQVRRNKLHDIKKLDRLRVERIRTNEENDKFWYSKKWTKYSKTDLVYDAFVGVDAKDQSDSILYFKNPSGRHIYGYAPYWSSLGDIATCYALSEYGLSTVNNAFCPSGVISLVEGKPSEDEAKQVEKDLNAKFAGTKNAAKLLVTFSDSPEGAPKITSFQPSDLNAHYLSLKETVQNNIFTAFSMDPILVGVKTTDGVFSDSAYQEAFKLFNKTEILPIQQQIIKAFKKLGYDLEFKPFKIDWIEENGQETVVTNEGEENNKTNNELA